MFALDNHNGSIGHLNLRAEKHGDENAPACDIKITVDLPSTDIDHISPGLCESLFRMRGRRLDMPRRTEQDSGRNGMKRRARAGLPRKQWPVIRAT